MSNTPPPLCEAACQRFEEVHNLLHEMAKEQRELTIRMAMLDKALLRLVELMNAQVDDA